MENKPLDKFQRLYAMGFSVFFLVFSGIVLNLIFDKKGEVVASRPDCKWRRCPGNDLNCSSEWTFGSNAEFYEEVKGFDAKPLQYECGLGNH